MFIEERFETLYYTIVMYLYVHMGAARPCSMLFIYFICLMYDIL